MASCRGPGRSAAIFAGQKIATENGFDAQSPRQGLCHVCDIHAHRLANASEVGPVFVKSGDLGEGIALLPSMEVCYRDWPVSDVVARHGFLQVNQALRMRIWQRAQEEAVENAEDRRARGNPQCQRQHRHSCECDVLSQQASGIARVLDGL
jgi:hypothetical protein